MNFYKLPVGKIFALANEITVKPQLVISKNICEKSFYNLTLYSFGEGEGITWQKIPGDILIYVLDGETWLETKEKKTVVKEKALPGNILFVKGGNEFQISGNKPYKLCFMAVNKLSGGKEVFIKNFEQMLNDSLERGLISHAEDFQDYITNQQDISNYYVMDKAVIAGMFETFYESLTSIYNSSKIKLAEGTDLDDIGDLVGVARPEATRASAVVTFTLLSALDVEDGDVNIDEGIIVATDSGIEYITVEPLYISNGDKVIENTLTNILSSLEYDFRCTNAKGSSGGIEGYDDTRYRDLIMNHRDIKLKGSEYAYKEYFANFDGIDGYKLVPNWDGTGTMKIIVDPGTPYLLNQIYNEVQEEISQATEDITLFAPVEKNIDIYVNDITTKTKEEIVKYSKVFWELIDSLPEGQRILKNMERKEKLERQKNHNSRLICKKCENLAKDEYESIKINFPPGNHQSEFTYEDDQYLIYVTNKYGYGNWDDIMRDLKTSEDLLFNYYLKSRNKAEIQKRVDYLVKLIEREFGNLLPNNGENKNESSTGSNFNIIIKRNKSTNKMSIDEDYAKNNNNNNNIYDNGNNEDNMDMVTDDEEMYGNNKSDDNNKNGEEKDKTFLGKKRQLQKKKIKA
mgnify:CR=1 FL=1